MQAAGFKTESVAGVELGVDQKVRVDVTLTIGDVSEAVVVRTRNSLVQRSASDLGATLNGAEMQALPLNGRNFILLTRTLPGVVRGVPGENIDGAGSVGWRASASFSANGQRNRDNNFLLDGLDNTRSGSTPSPYFRASMHSTSSRCRPASTPRSSAGRWGVW